MSKEETFGLRLRSLRQERNLRQVELAAQMEERYGVVISSSYLSELERSEKRPSPEVIAAIARVLDTSTDFLLALTDDPTPCYGGNTRVVFETEDALQAQVISEWVTYLLTMQPSVARMLLSSLHALTTQVEVKPWRR